MTERQFQTIRWAVILACLASFLFMLIGCSSKSPTGPQSYLEQMFLSYAQCFATHKNLGTVTLTTFRERRFVGGQGSYVACAAWPHSRNIECDELWINDTQHIWQFRGVAGHEVCHLTGIWDEQMTERCNQKMLESGVCS